MSERKATIERLDLTRETVRDLTESEVDGAVGGLMCGSHHVCPSKSCLSTPCNPCTVFDVKKR